MLHGQYTEDQGVGRVGTQGGRGGVQGWVWRWYLVGIGTWLGTGPWLVLVLA